MTHEASASTTTNSVPQQRTGGAEPAAADVQVGAPEGSVGPLPLERLLSGAVLTPAQACLVAARLLEAAREKGAADEASRGGVRLGAVALTPAGDIDVDPAGATEDTGLAELLSNLLHNARRLPAHPRPEQLFLLHRLEETAGDARLEPGARARALEGALADTLGPAYRERLSGQFAALVAAFAHVAPSVPAAIDTGPRPLVPALGRHRPASSAPGPSRPRRAAPRPVAPPRPAHRYRVLLHRRGRGWRVALVVVVLAAVVVGGGYVMLRGPGVGVVGALGLGSPAAPNSTAPPHSAKQPVKHPRQQRHHVRAVPDVASRHAGAVTGVTVRKIGGCKPGARCAVRVTVHLRPASATRSVGWKLGAARLCKRGLTWSGRTTVTAHPGWSKVYARSSIRVPQGRSLALIALTTTPARAQSRPIPVTGSSLHC